MKVGEKVYVWHPKVTGVIVQKWGLRCQVRFYSDPRMYYQFEWVNLCHVRKLES